MVVSKAQMRAKKKWEKENIKQFKFRLHKDYDKEIISYLDEVSNKQEYFRNLITKDLIEKGILPKDYIRPTF